MVEIGEKIKSRLKEKNDPNTYNLWLRPLIMESRDHTLVVTSSSEFSCKMVRNKFSGQIRDILKDITEKDYRIRFQCRPGEENGPRKPEKNPRNSLRASSSKTPNFFDISPQNDLRLSNKFTFKSFVVGKNNQLASAAAKAVVHSLGSSYNPLFIYGKTGLGKTHLMQAIGHEVMSQDARKKVVYLPCEEFMNQMIDAIRKNTMQKFRSKFRKVDILMLDDIQFLAKKEQTQEEFFNTFNALYHDHKQIVLTSDCAPKDLVNLQERLVSRFEWGLVTDVQPPSFETRVSILRKKCELSRLKVSMEVIHFLSEHFKENVRQMEGALNRVYTYSRLINKPLDVILAREILKDLIKSEKAKRITIEEILQKVGQFYKITILQMQGPKRLKNFVFPRQVAMYISRNLTDLSLPEIGDAFGGRDHTTVLHACRTIKRKMENSQVLKDEINRISQSLVNS